MLRITKPRFNGRAEGIGWSGEFDDHSKHYVDAMTLVRDVGILDDMGLQETIELRFGAMTEFDDFSKVWFIYMEIF